MDGGAGEKRWVSGFPEAASVLYDETIGSDTKEPTKRKAFDLLVDWFKRDAEHLMAKIATW
jgi:hypothetical protein